MLAIINPLHADITSVSYTHPITQISPYKISPMASRYNMITMQYTCSISPYMYMLAAALLKLELSIDRCATKSPGTPKGFATVPSNKVSPCIGDFPHHLNHINYSIIIVIIATTFYV